MGRWVGPRRRAGDIVSRRRFMVLFMAPSWAEPVQVAGEQGDLPDVGGAGEPGGPAFQGDGESAVRWHPVGEHVEVAGVGRRVLAALAAGRQVVCVPGQPLSAGDTYQ